MTTEQQDQPEPATPKLAGITAETKAMAAAHIAISKLDRAAQMRVTNWLTTRLADEWHDAERRRYDDEPPF